MMILLTILGWTIVAAILWDAFATVVIPKTVERRFSFSGIYYNATWLLWHRCAACLKDGPFRQALLSAFAPITLLILFLLWAVMLIVAFALIQFSHESLVGNRGLVDYLYLSGETFFTLGYGDMTPRHRLGQFISVTEAGTGFAFLALVIGYIPVMYGHFSNRERLIVKLDSRAGSNPSAGELLRRHSSARAMEELVPLLKEWEDWSAQQLEAYLSYPVLAYYRSQHDHQSWLCSLTAILDACALIEVGFEGDHECADLLRFQAQATFAMGRHVIVDLAYLLDADPIFVADRLPPEKMAGLRSTLASSGLRLKEGRDDVLASRRALYEPYCLSLATDLYFTLPEWVAEEGAVDNWQFTAWDKEEHFSVGSRS